MIAAFSGSMMPLRKNMYTSVLPRKLYREMPYAAMEPSSTTKTMEMAVNRTLLKK